jgi:geranylgeranyl pyrophosphate synthase/predicted secreted hydrolase
VKKIPPDWPAEGPVDLSVHDLPHASATTEWWYINGHCVVSGGQKFSFFAAFFRKVQGYLPGSKTPRYVHSLTWSLLDIDQQKNYPVARVDERAASEGLRRIQAGYGSRDPRLNRAICEMLERGVVPKPDRVFDAPVHVELSRLELDFGGDTFRKNDDASYTLSLFHRNESFGCKLTLTPRKPPIRHGHEGVVRGSEDESMFYYFIPRCELTGSITQDGVEREITQGQAWYDHEFGVGVVDDPDLEAEAKLPTQQLERVRTERRATWDARQVGWNWISAQLEDATELTVYPEQYIYTGKPAGDYAITIGPKGERETWEGATLLATEWWQSSQTFVEYPIRWTLEIPKAQIKLDVRAAFADQEVMTLIARNSFYEGRVEVSGTKQGAPVKGLGFVERSGLGLAEDLDGFFEQVGKIVRRSVEQLVPLKPSVQDAHMLLAPEDKAHYLDGVDLEQYGRTHLAPVREIVDRGGKGWRSYAMTTCIDVVGGDSRDFVEWLAIPELMHVGSLIVDDVQDRSTVRRGGPTAHLIFGEGQAINSGTAAYFLGAGVLRNNKLSAAQLVQLYELYFDGLRAGHAGQALDLDGFETIMGRVALGEDANLLEKRVLAVHRLKTAAPAGCLARIGAMAGGGTTRQIDALGRFFEDIGLAFQIVDDVLNLRGFRGQLKSKAEDVMHGKITLPVAKAMPRLALDQRKWLCETLRSKPEDMEVVNRVVSLLEECGAIEACAKQARELVEIGWDKLSPLVDDSMAKMMLRAFGWYVLERHY